MWKLLFDSITFCSTSLDLILFQIYFAAKQAKTIQKEELCYHFTQKTSNLFWHYFQPS